MRVREDRVSECEDPVLQVREQCWSENENSVFEARREKRKDEGKILKVKEDLGTVGGSNVTLGRRVTKHPLLEVEWCHKQEPSSTNSVRNPERTQT